MPLRARHTLVLLLPALMFACAGGQGLLGGVDFDPGEVVAFSGHVAESGLDEDGDRIGNFAPDNCAGVYNPLQRDLDLDGLGDLCDHRPSIPDTLGVPFKRGMEARQAFFDEVNTYADSIASTQANSIHVTMVRVCDQGGSEYVALEASNLKGGLLAAEGTELAAVTSPELRIGFHRLAFELDDIDAFRAANPPRPGVGGDPGGYGDRVRVWDDTNDDDRIGSGETVYGSGRWMQRNESHVGVLFGMVGATYTYPTSAAAACNPEDPDCTEPPETPESPDCDEQTGDPIVLDLGGNGFAAFSAPEVRFDLDSDGAMDLVGWPTSPDDALLALDRNGDGLINDGNELFSNFTDGGAYANGFEALAALDDDGNGAIDASDAAYADLVLWQDKNGDGLSQVDELSALGASGVASISVHYISMNETDANGNETRQRAAFTYEDGTAGLAIDVWFAMSVSPL